MHVYGEYKKSESTRKDEKIIIMATASPFKFAKDVYAALNNGGAFNSADKAKDKNIYVDSAASEAVATGDKNIAGNIDEIKYIDLLNAATGETVPKSLQGLRDRPLRHLTETTKEHMKETALDILTKLAGP
jgi:threonine synthase